MSMLKKKIKGKVIFISNQYAQYWYALEQGVLALQAPAGRAGGVAVGIGVAVPPPPPAGVGVTVGTAQYPAVVELVV